MESIVRKRLKTFTVCRGNKRVPILIKVMQEWGDVSAVRVACS